MPVDKQINLQDDIQSVEGVSDLSQVQHYQKWIKIALANKDKPDRWAKEGDRVYLGDGCDPYNSKGENARYKNEDGLSIKGNVNFLRKKVEAQLTTIYNRNPTFTGTPTKPKMVPAPDIPVPAQPMIGTNGVPMVDTMGQPAMTPAHMMPDLDEMGQPRMIDISDDQAEVVSQCMNHVFKESSFKSDIKACIREAQHRPASILQIGYQFNEDQGLDDIYFRRRSFYDFIIDPNAKIYDGAVRRCRYMGIRWTITEKEAKAMGLEWESLSDKANLVMGSDPQGIVYQIWDKETNMIVWCPESGGNLAKEPREWPWVIDGFPFEILKFTEDTDEQFSRSMVQEAMPTQQELNVQRKMIMENTTARRPVTYYDPNHMDTPEMKAYIEREGGVFIPVQGLMGMPNNPIRTVNDSDLDTEFYNHYQQNKQEMDEILGTTANEQLQGNDMSATQSEIVDKNAGISSSGKTDVITDFLDRSCRKAVQIMRQTYTTERVTQITGDDGGKYWVTWTGEEVLDEVTLNVEVGSTERQNSEIKKQVSLNLLDTMKGIPGIDVVKLAIDVLKDNGRRNAEQYRIEDPMAGMSPDQAGGGVPMDTQASLAGQMSPNV